MTETTWLWIGVLGLGLGAVTLALRGGRRTPDEESHTQVHVIVLVLATLSYFSLATGQGVVTLPGGREVPFARYLDWAVTTPLLLLGLAMTALHGAHRRPGLVAALLGADVLMIATGSFYALSEATGPKWTWFLVSCGAFLAVYATLFGPLRREAQVRDAVRRTAYRHDLALLSGLWLGYPVIDLLGISGTAVLSPTTTTAAFTVLDLLSKVLFGVVATTGSRRVAEHDLAGGAGRPAGLS